MTPTECTPEPLAKRYPHYQISDLVVELEVVSAELTELVNFFGRIVKSSQKLALQELEQELNR